MKKVIYTVLLGNDEKFELHEPRHIDKNWSMICFTDRDITSENWEIRKVDHNDPLKKSREIKIRCDKFIDFDICLYMDSIFTVNRDVNKFIDNNIKGDFTVMSHPRRHCAYREARYCLKEGKGGRKTILRQIERYQKDGFPKDFGLYACGIMVRKNTKAVVNFMKLWFDEVKKNSYRDQISFPYILWKAPIDFNVVPFRRTYYTFRWLEDKE